MVDNNSHLKYVCIDLELESIQRFRDIASVLPPDCYIYRELDQNSTVLCLDFQSCPQTVKIGRKLWFEFCRHLLACSISLGLAESLRFQLGDRIVSLISLDKFKQ